MAPRAAADAKAAGKRYLIATLRGRPAEAMERSSTDMTDHIFISHMDALAQLIDHLLEHTEKIQAALAVVSAPAFNLDSSKSPSRVDRMSDPSCPWPEQYVSWSLIPKVWLWLWMRSQCADLTDSLIERMEGHSKKTCREVFEYATGLRDGMKVPHGDIGGRPYGEGASLGRECVPSSQCSKNRVGGASLASAICDSLVHARPGRWPCRDPQLR